MERRAVKTLSGSTQEEYSLSRAKLPKELSYPLKRSILDAALRAASVYEQVYSVHYVGRPYDGIVLYATFLPEGVNHPSVSGRSSVAVRAVENRERKSCEQLLILEGLPTLCGWLARSRAEGDAWRALHHSLTIRIIGGRVRQQED